MRNERRRRTNAVYLIAVPGKSEDVYFNYIRTDRNLPHRGVTIKIKQFSDSNPDQMLRKAKTSAQEWSSRLKTKVQVLLVVDCDSAERQGTRKEKFDVVCVGGAGDNYKAFYSNPCFEIWLLMHFVTVAQLMSPTTAEFTLKQLLPGYTKGVIPYRTLSPKLPAARFNAADAEKLFDEKSPPSDRNPSTTIHHLIDLLCKETN